MSDNHEEKSVVTKAVVPVDPKTGMLAPSDFDGIYRVANLMAKSGMVPEEYQNNVPAIIVAGQRGKELGLSWSQALDAITVINGKPSVYADGLTGLLNGSGKVEDWEEKYMVKDKEVDPADMPLDLSEWPDNLKAVCVISRNGRKTPSKGSFSVADAKRQGTWNKPNRKGKSVWQKHPARMLMWRARSYAARDGFSDVLKGIHVFEEVIDYEAEAEVVEQPVTQAQTESLEEKFRAACVENMIIPEDAIKYIDESCEMIGCARSDLVYPAIENMADFKEKFLTWLKAQEESFNESPDADRAEDPKEDHFREDVAQKGESTLVDGKPVGEPKEEDFFPGPEEADAFQGEKEELPVVEDDGDPMGTEGEESEEPPITEETVKKVFTARDELINQLWTGVNEAGRKSDEYEWTQMMDDYFAYIAEVSKQDLDDVMKTSANNGDWFEYFLGWVDEPEAVGRKREEKQTEITTGEQYESYIEHWNSLPGLRFKTYIEKNPEHFDQDRISAEEYAKAKEKWNKLVYSRTKEEWPIKRRRLDQEQGEVAPHDDKIKTPEINPRQLWLKVVKKYPEEAKKVQNHYKMAQHPGSDDAAQKLIDGVKHIVQGGNIKDLK